MNQELAYLNGEFMPLSEAQVPVLDRGFLFADGVYEMLPAYGGYLFGLDEHLQRLQKSLDGISLQNPLQNSEWRAMLQELTQRAGDHDQAIYLQVTRGVSAKRAHIFPEHVKQTVFAMSTVLKPMSEIDKATGIRVICHEDIRWSYCHLKTISLLGNVLMQQAAHAAGAQEALTLRNGFVTEGSSSNFFIVSGGVILTPPKSESLLPGITRQFVLSLADKHNMPWREQDLQLEQVMEADEVWISSSSREVVPVIAVDAKPIGDGKAGPVWRQMTQHYETMKQQLRRGKNAFEH